mmetsp:Transcript_30566/g.56476  ORF Transcript_30566/g.56476 Transcript_30566/m.56476 type:complete len:253 (-) Transcript_30566:622-1380(-)
MPKPHPLIRSIHVLAKEQTPINKNIRNARPDQPEYPPRRTHANVLGQENGTQYRPSHRRDNEEDRRRRESVTLFHRLPDEPQRRHIQKVMDQSRVQYHGTEQSIPLSLIHDEGGLLGPHPYQGLGGGAHHGIDVEGFDLPSVESVGCDEDGGAHDEEDVGEEGTIESLVARLLEVGPAEVGFLVGAAPCRVFGPFDVESYSRQMIVQTQNTPRPLVSVRLPPLPLREFEIPQPLFQRRTQIVLVGPITSASA